MRRRHSPLSTENQGNLILSHFLECSPLMCSHSVHHTTCKEECKANHFLQCDAMRCTVSVIVILSVRPSVRLSVRLSVCHTRGLCPHGSTYDHDFFTTG